MAINYPTSLDTFSNPSAGNKTNNVTTPHASQHANANDAIEAIEAKVGTGSSTPAAGKILVGTGSGASAWKALGSAGQLIRANSGATDLEWFTVPVFSAIRSANVSNVSGNGTVYTCPFDTAHISNAGYSTSTGIFTVPAGEGGVYLFDFVVSLVAGGSSQTQGVIQLVTTGQTWRMDSNPYSLRNTASGVLTIAGSFIAVMSAGDTAKVNITISGGPTDSATFVGGSGFSSFAGAKLRNFA